MKTFPSIGTSTPGATGAPTMMALSAFGMYLAAAQAVNPEQLPPYIPTCPALQGWAAIQSISAAASLPSYTYGTMRSGLHAFPRVYPMTPAYPWAAARRASRSDVVESAQIVNCSRAGNRCGTRGRTTLAHIVAPSEVRTPMLGSMMYWPVSANTAARNQKSVTASAAP